MKRLGKITFAVIMLILAVGILSLGYLNIENASAETYVTRTLILPFNGETAKTIVMRDAANGNVINKTTGASASNTAWADGENAGSAHTYSGDWVFTIIVSDTVKEAYFTYYNVAPASITAATTPDSNAPILYNPKTGKTYTDTNPREDQAVKVTQTLYE